MGQAIGGSSSPSNSEGPAKKGAKVLTQIGKRHAIGRGREDILPPKRMKAKKSVSSFAKEEKGRLFTWSGGR